MPRFERCDHPRLTLPGSGLAMLVMDATSLVRRAQQSDVWSLFAAQARQHPEAPALSSTMGVKSYAKVMQESAQLASLLEHLGVTHGDRVAILSENREEYLELSLACACIGAILACQNWRLTPRELGECIRLVEPVLLFVSQTYQKAASEAGLGVASVIEFGADLKAKLASAPPQPSASAIGQVEPEDLLLLLYTSGTTGLPKAASLSHRAEIVRNLVTRAEFGIAQHDSFVAWSPLYHMGAMDNSLGTLMSGGQVILVDGFDVERLLAIVESEALGWLLLMPGMVGRFVDALRCHHTQPCGVRVCGVMADLVPRHEIAEVTRLLGAPYANTFGSTETGCPPCSSSLIPVGAFPDQLSKRQSPFCEVRLVDAEDEEVAQGMPGELCMRGPTLFSGYFQDPETTRVDFRGGWFHMGDVFRRNPDGTLDFVDRLKYMIKSGGENVYPAEIEAVLLAEPGVLEAAVVRRPDERWGEVPVAFVARSSSKVTAERLFERCRASLARYKLPKVIQFLELDAFPRSASGKVQRHQLENQYLTSAGAADLEGTP